MSNGNVSSNSNEFITKENIEQYLAPFLNKTKEEIFTNVFQNFEQIKNTINQNANKHDLAMLEYDKNQNVANKRIESLQEYNAKNEQDHLKIVELKNFEDFTEERIFQQDILIKNIKKELADATEKINNLAYNLEVPSLIGKFCENKTIKDYITNYSNKVNSLMNFKELINKEIQSSREKLEKLYSKENSLNNILENNIKCYVHNLLDIYGKKKDDENVELFKKMDEIRMENNKHAIDLVNATKITTAEHDKVIILKTEIYRRLEDSLDEIIDRNKEINDKYECIKTDIKFLNTKIIHLSTNNNSSKTNKRKSLIDSNKKLIKVNELKTVKHENGNVMFSDEILSSEGNTGNSNTGINNFSNYCNTGSSNHIQEITDFSIEDYVKKYLKERINDFNLKELLNETNKEIIKGFNKSNDIEICDKPKSTSGKNDSKRSLKELYGNLVFQDKDKPKKIIMKNEKEICDSERSINTSTKIEDYELIKPAIFSINFDENGNPKSLNAQTYNYYTDKTKNLAINTNITSGSNISNANITESKSNKSFGILGEGNSKFGNISGNINNNFSTERNINTTHNVNNVSRPSSEGHRIKINKKKYTLKETSNDKIDKFDATTIVSALNKTQRSSNNLVTVKFETPKSKSTKKGLVSTQIPMPLPPKLNGDVTDKIVYKSVTSFKKKKIKVVEDDTRVITKKKNSSIGIRRESI